MSLPRKCLVDTNVPINANLFTNLDPDSDVPDECVLACVEAIDQVVKQGGLVLDSNDEIFTEYRSNLSLSGHRVLGIDS